MKIHLTTKNASSGQFAQLSSKHRPDKYRWPRVGSGGNLHRGTFTLEQFIKEQPEFDFHIASSPWPVEISIEIEDSDRDNGEVLATLRKDLADSFAREGDLAKEVERLQTALAERPADPGATGLTAEQLSILTAAAKERDAMMELLQPLALPTESGPLEVLQRLTADAEETEAATEAMAGLLAEESKAEFDVDEFRKTLPKKANKLKPMAAVLGIPGYAEMSAAELTEAIVLAEIARGSTAPPTPPENPPGAPPTLPEKSADAAESTPPAAANPPAEPPPAEPPAATE